MSLMAAPPSKSREKGRSPYQKTAFFRELASCLVLRWVIHQGREHPARWGILGRVAPHIGIRLAIKRKKEPDPKRIGFFESNRLCVQISAC